MQLVKYEHALGVDQSSLIPRQHFMIYPWGLEEIDCFFSWMERYFVRGVFWVSKQESLKPCSHRSSASVLTLLGGSHWSHQYHTPQTSTSSSSLALMLWSPFHTHSQASTLTLGVIGPCTCRKSDWNIGATVSLAWMYRRTVRRCTDVERSKQALLRLALCVDFFLRRQFKQKQLQFELNPFT